MILMLFKNNMKKREIRGKIIDLRTIRVYGIEKRLFGRKLSFDRYFLLQEYIEKGQSRFLGDDFNEELIKQALSNGFVPLRKTIKTETVPYAEGFGKIKRGVVCSAKLNKKVAKDYYEFINSNKAPHFNKHGLITNRDISQFDLI